MAARISLVHRLSHLCSRATQLGDHRVIQQRTQRVERLATKVGAAAIGELAAQVVRGERTPAETLAVLETWPRDLGIDRRAADDVAVLGIARGGNAQTDVECIRSQRADAYRTMQHTYQDEVAQVAAGNRVLLSGHPRMMLPMFATPLVASAGDTDTMLQMLGFDTPCIRFTLPNLPPVEAAWPRDLRVTGRSWFGVGVRDHKFSEANQALTDILDAMAEHVAADTPPNVVSFRFDSLGALQRQLARRPVPGWRTAIDDYALQMWRPPSAPWPHVRFDYPNGPAAPTVVLAVQAFFDSPLWMLGLNSGHQPRLLDVVVRLREEEDPQPPPSTGDPRSLHYDWHGPGVSLSAAVRPLNALALSFALARGDMEILSPHDRPYAVPKPTALLTESAWRDCYRHSIRFTVTINLCEYDDTDAAAFAPLFGAQAGALLQYAAEHALDLTHPALVRDYGLE